MVAHSKEVMNDSAKTKLVGSNVNTSPFKINDEENQNKHEQTANFIDAQEITLQDDQSENKKETKIVPFERITAGQIPADQLYLDKSDKSIIDQDLDATRGNDWAESKLQSDNAEKEPDVLT